MMDLQLAEIIYPTFNLLFRKERIKIHPQENANSGRNSSQQAPAGSPRACSALRARKWLLGAVWQFSRASNCVSLRSTCSQRASLHAARVNSGGLRPTPFTCSRFKPAPRSHFRRGANVMCNVAPWSVARGRPGRGQKTLNDFMGCKTPKRQVLTYRLSNPYYCSPFPGAPKDARHSGTNPAGRKPSSKSGRRYEVQKETGRQDWETLLS